MKNNTASNRQRITDEIKDKMVQDYLSGMSAPPVAKKYGFKTSKTVYDVLKSRGIKCREPWEYKKYNLDIFENIDSHEKAYILGLLMTDGYVLKEYEGIGIQLQMQDAEILKKIGPVFGESVTYLVTKPKKMCSNKSGKKYKTQSMLRMLAHSPKISRDLKAWGVIKQKTKMLKLLKPIPDEYLFSFLRGVWDGDGTVGVHSKNGHPWCQFVTASKEFAEQIVNMNHGYEMSIWKYNGSTYCVSLLGGTHEKCKFMKRLYENNNGFYIRRKLEKVQGRICEILGCETFVQYDDEVKTA